MNKLSKTESVADSDYSDALTRLRRLTKWAESIVADSTSLNCPDSRSKVSATTYLTSAVLRITEKVTSLQATIKRLLDIAESQEKQILELKRENKRLLRLCTRQTQIKLKSGSPEVL